MTAQHGEVFRLQEILVPDLDGVTERSGDLLKESIQHSNEISAVLKIAGIKVGELEDEDAHFFLESVKRRQESLFEEIGIQEVLVRFSSQSTKPRKVRVGLDGDGVRDLETEFERVGDLLAQSLDVLRGRELVVTGIHTRRWKDLSVFSKAFTLKLGL